MMPAAWAAWAPSGAALKSHNEHALSQVGTDPDTTLDVPITQNSNKQAHQTEVTKYYYMLHVAVYYILIVNMNTNKISD